MTPEQTLKHIQRYIARQHVFSLFTHHHNDIWPASCYYAFDAKSMSLILMTDSSSKHGQLMVANPQVAGTISTQSKAVSQIQGIQFKGFIERLEGEKEQLVRAQYCRRFPVALTAKLPVWQLHLDNVKMVDNKLGFGTKLYWERQI
ncbi:YhbP family protein [Providencia huaxiensis]|uniref:YhbP family protein n=1 Tax=Providencia TaxID=586 RepID=UPI00234A16CF|nr:YhbP family protein [Providencia sp. PROV032]